MKRNSYKLLLALSFWLLITMGAGIGVTLARDAGPDPGPSPLGVTQGTTLALPNATVAPGGQVTMSLTLTGAANPLYSADIVVTYDPAVVTATAVARGALVPNWSLASNLDTAGVVRIALAGAQPVTGDGELAAVAFEAEEIAGTATDLTLSAGNLNEGTIGVNLQNGRITVATAPCYDFVAPPGVGAEDIQDVATHWRQHAGDAGWDTQLDLNSDGVINILDILKVSAQVGQTCP